MILDVGPQSVERIHAAIDDAATLVWNGPLGAFELTPFDKATVVAPSTPRNAPSRQAGIGRRRRRYRGGAQPCRVGERFQLRLDRGRRVPGMDGRQAAARRRGAAGKVTPPSPQCACDARKSAILPRIPRSRFEETHEETSMNLADLNKVPRAMVAPGKGILAADESSGTIKKRFDAIGVESTEDNRRDYREMLFRSTEAMTKYISGVILYDETIWQKAKDGTPLVEFIKTGRRHSRHQGRQGRQAAARLPGEMITEGLDRLAERLKKYYQQGARFAKWRAVIDIADGIPSYAAIRQRPRAGPLRRAVPGGAASCRSSSRKC